MKGLSRVILGVKLTEDEKSFEAFRKLDFLKDADIDLVHVTQVPDLSTFSELGLAAYPNPELKLVIEHAVMAKLKELASSFTASGFRGRLSCHCFLSDAPRKKFCQYANESKAQLVVLVPESTPVGFGSFIHHQFTHCSVPLFILREV